MEGAVSPLAPRPQASCQLEAVTNAIEHAYVDGAPGAIDVSIVDGGDRLVIEVRDQGHWRPDPSDPDRGRGFPVIKALTEEFERRTRVRGTTVSFRLPLNGSVG